MDHNEELLTEVTNRFVMFPIRYNSIWSMYKKAESAFWTAEEIDLSKDMNDWEKLSDNEKHFVKHILAFFAGSDGIVNENLSARFLNEVKPPEAKAFYGFQIAMENIHCVTGDTEVFTRHGYQSIQYLAERDPEVEVWNGHEFSRVTVQKTSESAPIYNVILSNGMYLKCTSQHKWLIKGHEDRVFTENLQEGMILQDFEYPHPAETDLRNQQIFARPFQHGAACATLDSADYDMVNFNMRPKYFVPINFDIDTKIQWLTGLFQHATVNFTSEEHTTIFQSPVVPFMRSLQRLLTTLNVRSNLHIDDSSTNTLTINIHNTQRLMNIGVTICDCDTNQMISKTNPTQAHGSDVISIAKIIKLANPAPTYCFNEPLRHTGIFNGILTGQSETYSLLIDTYIKNAQEKKHLFNAISTIPCIKKKADWALKWIENKDASFAMRLIAFACVEGIFFSGAFCSIFWLKERGVMPGLCLSNEFISRDEGLHTEFAVLLYSMLKNKLSENMIQEIIKEAVSIEDEFINESIPCNLLGMNAELMSQYIKFVADRLVVQLGHEKIWKVANPFDFMERIGLENKSNFFEHTRLSEYAKANVGAQKDDTHKFSLNEDF